MALLFRSDFNLYTRSYLRPRRDFSTTALKQKQWPFLKHEMVEFFASKGTYVNTVASPYELEVFEWPRFYRHEFLKAEGYIPSMIYKYGPYQRFCLKASDIHHLAFEEEDGHLSMHFSARPFKLKFKNRTEICVVEHTSAHPVDKEIHFLKFARHVPGQITTLDIPCSLLGLLACPAYMKGYQVELALNKIRCEIAGEHFPLPFKIDVSKLNYKEPYSAIYLNELTKHLHPDGSVRFHPDYDLNQTEVVWTYQPGTLPERKLPSDWIDPNFINRYGNRINLTYKGFWPKQS